MRYCIDEQADEGLRKMVEGMGHALDHGIRTQALCHDLRQSEEYLTAAGFEVEFGLEVQRSLNGTFQDGADVANEVALIKDDGEVTSSRT